MTIASTWTDEYIATLSHEWADGRTATQIVDILRHRHRAVFTRNAVIGKVHRLGVKRKTDNNFEAEPPKLRRQRVKIVALKPKSVPVAPAEPIVPALSIEPIAPVSVLAKNVPLHERDAKGCCFPVNDGGPYLYCNKPGALLHEGWGHYCEEHAKLMFKKPRGPIYASTQ